MSLRLKTILGVAVIEAVLLCFIIWYGLEFLRDSNTGQLDKRAKLVANLYAATSKAEILSLDLATLESQVDVLFSEPGVVFAQVASASRGVLVQRGDPVVPGDGLRSAKAVIEENGVIFGWVEVGLSDESIGLVLEDARKKALAVSVAGIMVTAMFSAVLGIYLTRQLSKLARASDEIAGGNFGHRILVHGKDELAKVAGAFNHMTEELDRSYAQMEERIRARTAELARSNEALVGEVAERKQAHRDISQILSAVSAMLIGLDAKGRILRFNQAAEQALGRSAAGVLGQTLPELALPWEEAKALEALERCRAELAPVKVSPLSYTRADGREGFLLLTASPVLGAEPGGPLEGMLLLLDDITDVRALEGQLAQAQRLESIGQLAAGIAHEINTPTQYVGDSIVFLKNAFTDLQSVVNSYELLAAENSCSTPEAFAEQLAVVRKTLDALDYDFLMEEVPKSFDMIQDGMERVRSIVLAMRRFAHPGDGAKKAVDLNLAVENTLVVSRNEWKYVAEAVTELAPDLPLVVCLPGEINQVLLGLIVNAAHAIGDKVAGTPELGRITVSTRQDGEAVIVSVADTGTGIPESARPRIFDPFYTTKEVGRGTGQGLTIAYDIVVSKHGGAITFETELGQGTTFHIRLPLGAEAGEGG